MAALTACRARRCHRLRAEVKACRALHADIRYPRPVMGARPPLLEQCILADEFEYDVAFSFNAMDEAIATQLNDRLSGRLKTFIYSERQREIAGTDGQESFSQIYGKTARLVVVL